ncbi:MAG: hypothetical protein C5B55_05725 [Blastocatellia bacterium]|nr:MAG: hypothetical protein C5B55_05725 [Blastocatellia bacterium]
MKSIMNRLVVVMVVGALTSVVAFAKVHKSNVKFANDIKVNATVVKKGSYDVKFDDETGKLSIVKNGKVVAEANAKFETRAKKASDVQVRSSGSEDGAQLLGVTFGGSDKEIVLSNNGAGNSGSN